MKKINLNSVIVLLVLFCAVNLNSQTLSWVKQTGGSFAGAGYFITTDKEGNIYTTGMFQGETQDLDEGPAICTFNSKGKQNVFITKRDPEGNLIWARQMQGGISVGNAIAVDELGNVYTTGSFGEAVDFDPGDGVYNMVANGARSVFISKLDANGNFVWARSWGGAGHLNNSHAIKIDAKGNIITAGVFQHRSDFDPGPEVFTLAPFGNLDAFVSKFDANGNFIWAKQIGGTSDAAIQSLATDASGNIYTSGYFNGIIDFDPGVTTHYITSFKPGVSCIFVSKLNSNGNFVWAKKMGGEEANYSGIAYAIQVDGSGNVYTAGQFGDVVDFDPGPATFNLKAVRSLDVFVSKLDNLGNFIWAKQMGGTNVDIAYSLSLDATDNVYITGPFTSANCDFDPGAGTYELNSADGSVFLSVLNSSGDFEWAGQTGSEGIGRSIAVDMRGNIYATGSFKGAGDFDPGSGLAVMTSGSSVDDIYTVKLSPLNVLVSR